MWGIVKNSINSMIGTPLNEQGYGMQTHVLRSGGPESATIVESVLSVEGSGFLHDLMGLDNPTINQAGSYRIQFVADGVELVDFSSLAIGGMAQRPRLTLSRLRGYEIININASEANLAQEAPDAPLAFDTSLQVILTKQVAQASAVVLGLQAHLWVHTSAKVQTHERSANFRRLIFDTDTSLSIPANIRNNEIFLGMIGSGGAGANHNWTHNGMPGANGQIITEYLQVPANRTAHITVGRVVNPATPLGDSTFRFDGGELIRAVRGANGVGITTGSASPPVHTDPVFSGTTHGRGGRGGLAGDASSVGQLGNIGRVIIEYELV